MIGCGDYGKPGETASGKISIINFGDQPYTFRLVSKDDGMEVEENFDGKLERGTYGTVEYSVTIGEEQETKEATFECDDPCIGTVILRFTTAPDGVKIVFPE